MSRAVVPPSCTTSRAVFLDRDGVLTIPQFRDGRSFAPRSLSEFKVYPDAPLAVRRLREAGFLVVVATNQPDVANGLTRREIVEEMHRRLHEAMPLDAIKVCFHSKGEGCACRKPRPGMLVEASRELGIDLASSFMVGDRSSDVEAGRAAGCRAVFVDLGYMAEEPPQGPDAVVGSIAGAADWILMTRSKQET